MLSLTPFPADPLTSHSPRLTGVLRSPGSYGARKNRTNHEFHETCHSVTFYFIKKDSKQCRDTITPESIHTKDESKRGSAFAFIFGVN